MDKPTFVALVEEKSAMCYRIAHSFLRNEEDCKDALQEAVLKAWASRNKLRDEALFGTWLTRILIHECRNIQRKNRKYFLTSEVNPKETFTHDGDSGIWDALNDLPEKQRVPLVLHYIEGYDLQDIAKLLRLPQSTIRGRLYQARKALRLELIDEKEVIRHDA